MKKILFGVAALGLLGLAGAGVGLKAQDTVEAKAAAMQSIWIEIGNTSNWLEQSEYKYSKLAVYFFTDANGDGKAESEVWGGLYQMDGHTFFEYEYSANDCASMIVVRFSPEATVAAWGNVDNKGVWAQTKNKTKSSQVTIWDADKDDSYKCWADTNYRTMVTGSLTNDLEGVALNAFGRDGKNDMQVEASTVAVTAGQKFKVSWNGGEYAALDGGVDSAAFDTTTNPGYITAKATGNYDFYFKTGAKELWVEENAPEAAAHFAELFNAAMAAPCADQNADNKAAVSAIWSTWKSNYEALTPAAKYQFVNGTSDAIVQARSNYLHCVSRYELDAWTGGPSASPAKAVSTYQKESSIEGFVVPTTIGISLFALGAAVIVARKRRAE